MLAAPNEQQRPLFDAKDIVPFYLNNSPKIFPQTRYKDKGYIILRYIFDMIYILDHIYQFCAIWKFIISFCFCIRLKCSGIFAWPTNVWKSISGPKYDGKYLHKLVRDILKDTRLHQTLTNVVIPTFDIKKIQPVIFSSYQVISTYY